jgi:hypothetical protein
MGRVANNRQLIEALPVAVGVTAIQAAASAAACFFATPKLAATNPKGT